MYGPVGSRHGAYRERLPRRRQVRRGRPALRVCPVRDYAARSHRHGDPRPDRSPADTARGGPSPLAAARVPPPSTASAGAVPLYGMCCIFTPVIISSSSTPTCPTDPLPEEPYCTCPGRARASAIRPRMSFTGTEGCIATSSGDVRLALALEFRLLAGLRHPNIISVIDYGFDRKHDPFFTMQLIDEARTITRARWSGPRFFGLKRRSTPFARSGWGEGADQTRLVQWRSNAETRSAASSGPRIPRSSSSPTQATFMSSSSATPHRNG